MIYFRRVWMKLLTVLLVLWFAVLSLIKILGFLVQELNQQGVVNDRLSKINSYLINAKEYIEGLTILLCFILVVWFLLNLVTGQLKRDYYSVQLSKHLQRQTNQGNLQMNTIEENKANFWLKRLRIIKWRRRLIVLIPSGPNAAVEDVIQTRCNRYLINWLITNMKKYRWNAKLDIYNSLHFNWLYASEKKKYV